MPEAKVSLVSGVTTLTTAVSVLWKDSSTLYATFDLNGVPAGTYDIQVSEFGQTATDPGRFLVVNSSLTGSVQFHISSPTIIRGQSTVTIDYTNVGYTDAPAPLMELQATGALMPPPVAWYPCCPTIIPGYTIQSMQVLGLNQDGPAGILPPLYQGSISVNFVPTQIAAGFVSSFTLSVAQSASTPIDWARPMDESQAGRRCAGCLECHLAEFPFPGPLIEEASIGPGHRGDGPERAGSLHARYPALFGFLVQQSSDSLPTPTLGAVVTRRPRAPGMALTFGRTFLQSIDGRYQPGPFGLGWADTWDLQAITNEAGDVTIQGRGESGSSRCNPTRPTRVNPAITGH